MKHIIITGHSKGLGAGVAAALLSENNCVHGISRTDNSELQNAASTRGFSLNFYKCDLNKTNAIRAVMQKVALKISPENTSGVYLVNNAGIITPVGPLSTIDISDFQSHLNINLLAPIILIHEFVRLFQAMPVEKRILNISSGAALNHYYGWSAYCTSKAGLEMFARCVAAEQLTQKHPIHTMSVAPGVIDTEMQAVIRETSEKQFIHKNKFVELKNAGKLISPIVAGTKIAQLLLSPHFKNGERIDLRDSYQTTTS